MALIRCPECGKEVSDKAKACIHCGYPLDEIINNSIENCEAKVTLVSAGNNKIGVINVIREFLSLGLFEAKQLVDNAPIVLYEKVDASIADKIKIHLESAGASVEVIKSGNLEKKSEVVNNSSKNGVKVTLKSVGSNKIEIIKIIKEAFSIGLAETKEKVENLPCVLAEDMEVSKASALKSELERLGCVIEVFGDNAQACLTFEQAMKNVPKDIKLTNELSKAQNSLEQQQKESVLSCPKCGSEYVTLVTKKGFAALLNKDIFGNKIDESKEYICEFCSHKFKK